MRRSKPSTMCRSRPCEHVIRSKHKHQYGERGGVRRIHFSCHGTDQLLVTATPMTLCPALGGRKCIINW